MATEDGIAVEVRGGAFDGMSMVFTALPSVILCVTASDGRRSVYRLNDTKGTDATRIYSHAGYVMPSNTEAAD